MSETPQGTPRGRVSASRWVAVVVVLASVSLGIVLLRRGEGPPQVSSTTSSATIPATARRETRAPLDPAQFVGKAAAAHRVAREIPDVLDQLHCYSVARIRAEINRRYGR